MASYKQPNTKTQAQRAKADQDEEFTEPVAQDSTLTGDIDALLDEIDGVLEENAQEFVKQYIQEGGE